MKVQKIKLNQFDYSWLVLDNNHLPIKPITEFIRYLNNLLMQNQAVQIKAKDRENSILMKQNKLLRKQIEKIRQQLGVAYAELYKQDT